MHKNALFRGCTRPAMFLGVPYMPFTIAAGTCLLLTFYFDMFFLFLLPIVVLIMRQMARRDEMVFRLLGLRWQFRSKIRNVKHHNGMWVFTP
ncbi:MAG: type IV secretion system protein VirB3, partial [Stenotrophomonas sp.]